MAFRVRGLCLGGPLHAQEARRRARGRGRHGCGGSGSGGTSTPVVRQAAASSPYTWKNVRIDGGGFVPGIIFNQTEQNLIYARTDIGGAYRWDQAGQQLDPAAGLGRLEQLGLERRAQPRHRPGADQPGVRRGRHVHQQLGPNNGAILRSTDKGATWQSTDAAVQGRRQHARPRHGRAARGRPEPQQRPLLRRAERQRPVAEHRLRRDLGQGDQLPQRRQLRAGPGRRRTWATTRASPG